MLFAEEIFYEIYAHRHRICWPCFQTSKGSCACCIFLDFPGSCVFNWWSCRGSVFLIFIEHILHGRLVYRLYQWTNFPFAFFLVKNHYEIEVLPNAEKLTRFNDVRSLQFQKSARTNPWVLQHIFVDFFTVRYREVSIAETSNRNGYHLHGGIIIIWILKNVIVKNHVLLGDRVLSNLFLSKINDSILSVSQPLHVFQAKLIDDEFLLFDQFPIGIFNFKHETRGFLVHDKLHRLALRLLGAFTLLIAIFSTATTTTDRRGNAFDWLYNLMVN